MIELPADLAERWELAPPFLRLRTAPGSAGLSIGLTSNPPPRCFEQARAIDALEAAQMAKRKPTQQGLLL